MSEKHGVKNWNSAKANLPPLNEPIYVRRSDADRVEMVVLEELDMTHDGYICYWVRGMRRYADKWKSAKKKG